MIGVVLLVALVLTSSNGLPLPGGQALARQPVGTPTIPLDGTAASLLAQCPCEPSDKERFNGFVYPSDLPMTPAPDPGWTDEERRTETGNLLDARFTNRSPEVRDRALDVYREATALMDVRLAAALVMLVGTSGEPAVDVILEAEWSVLGFGNMTRPEWTAEPDQNEPWAIIINEQWQHEDFLWFSSILLHEALHSHRGDGVGREEEATAFLLQRIVLAELLAEYPEIAEQKSSLSRSQMTFLLGLAYNSLTVFEGRGDALYPEGAVDEATVWDDGPAGQYRQFTTAAPPMLSAMLANLGIDFSTAPDLNDDGVPDYTSELLELLVLDEIIDAPESRLNGEIMQALGEEALTLEFQTGEPSGPPTPIPTPTPAPATSPTAAPTFAAEPTPDLDGLADVLPSPPPTSPPVFQPQPTPRPPVQPQPTQPPPTRTPVPPAPVIPTPAPTQAPAPIPTSPPPTAAPIPTTVPEPDPIPTTAPPQGIEPAPTPAPNELGG